MVPAWKALQIPQALALDQDAEHGYQEQVPAGMRTPRRMRASGIAVRKLIRSRSVAAAALSGTERIQSRRPQPMLAGAVSSLVTHFGSTLMAAACRGAGASAVFDGSARQDQAKWRFWNGTQGGHEQVNVLNGLPSSHAGLISVKNPA